MKVSPVLQKLLSVRQVEETVDTKSIDFFELTNWFHARIEVKAASR
jgi:hypothetical protein